MSEMITDFYDQLKSLSRGYASVEYQIKEWRESDIKRVVFSLNGEDVDALTFLTHESWMKGFAKRYAEKLKDLIPR